MMGDNPVFTLTITTTPAFRMMEVYRFTGYPAYAGDFRTDARIYHCGPEGVLDYFPFDEDEEPSDFRNLMGQYHRKEMEGKFAEVSLVYHGGALGGLPAMENINQRIPDCVPSCALP